MNLQIDYIKKAECQLEKFTVSSYYITEGVFVLELSGELSRKTDFSCSSDFKHFIDENFLGEKLYFIVSFSEIKNAELSAGNRFFSILTKWPKLDGIYLIGTNDNFRLSIKLTTAQNPYLPVYWTDSVEQAIIALGVPYRNFQQTAAPQPVFMQSNFNPRFFELWDTNRKVWIIGKQKFRVLSQPDWFFEAESGNLYADIAVIEDRVLHIKFIGTISFGNVLQLRRVQDRIFAELELPRRNFFNLFDISALNLKASQVVKFFFSKGEPLLIGERYGFIGTGKIKYWLLQIVQFIGQLERKPIFFFNSLEEAFENIENRLHNKQQPPLFLSNNKNTLKKLIEEQEIENEILQNNIEISREKLFHIITKLNWQELDKQRLNPSENLLYKDIFRSLNLMREEFGQAWGMHQDKLWLLENHKEKALRAQLDPHFIFNSLNAIRHQIAEGRTEKASELLNDFSDMMRLILQSSLSDVVPLENEIGYLELYVRMEMLRFEGRFIFELDVAQNVKDTMAELQIPPMLIQPYLEQAIWERVLTAQSPCRLGLSFEIKDEALHCLLSDNGLSFREAQLRLNDFTKERAQRLKGLKTRLILFEEMYGCRIQIFQKEVTTGKGKLESQILIQIPQHCF